MKDLDKINVGNSANDNSGDTLRDAFIKVNDNFTEVEQAIETIPTKVSELENDSKFITLGEVPGVDLTPYAKKTEVTSAITPLSNEIEGIKLVNVTQGGDISDLQVKDTAQDAEIVLLKQKDLAQDNRLSTLESDVQGFVGDLSSVNGRIDNQATEIGDINDKMIRTVNGVGPDINGNVVVSGGIGTVTSVNGVEPDGSGAVTIPVGISDAPNDGKEYVRKNLAWSEAQGGGDVPTLDEVLGKGNTSIKSIRMDSDPEDWGDRSFMLDGDGLRITETSSGDVRGAFKGGYSYTEVNHRDTSIYLYNGEIEITKPLELPQATKDVQAPTFGQVKQWVADNGGSGGITDAPKDGKLYGRKDETWSEVPIPGVVIRSINAIGGKTYYLSGKGSSYTTKEALDLRISTKGSNEDALGLSATAIGYNTQALGNQSFSMGSQATAFGERSIAGGVTAMAMGIDSLALGRGTRANAKDSVALGPYSEASGVGASALGYWNEANEFGVTTVGMYCKSGPTRTTRVVGDAVFKVGVGTGSSNANRKDGLIVTNDGKVSAPSQNLDMITDAKQLATKEYVDSVATSGGGDDWNGELTAPNGDRYKITVNNNGSLVSTKIV